MRLVFVWVSGMVGCVGAVLPGEDNGSEDLADLEEPEASDSCRGCGSTSSTWPIESYTVDMTFVVDAPDDEVRREGLFRGAVLAADSEGDEPMATVEVELSLRGHWPEPVDTAVEVTGSTHFRIVGFVDVDGDADPDDPQPDEGDLVTNEDLDTHVARDGYDRATVYLDIVGPDA